MNARTVAYWAIFVALQVTGFVSLSFTNVHSNIAPLLLGIALLLPGGILVPLVNIPFVFLASVVVFLNFTVWAVMKKWGHAEWWPDK